jgi:hypothetical protein
MAEQLPASQKPDNVLIALGHSRRRLGKRAQTIGLGPRNRKRESGKYAEKMIDKDLAR